MTAGSGVVTGVSVAHERAAVDQLEAAAAESQRSAVSSLLTHGDVEEAFVLQTCNRVEAYVVGDDDGADALAAVTGPVSDDAAVTMGHEESLRHLLRVAAGLESVVLGEDQVLGQVRDAYEDARAVGGIGPVLEEAVTKAIHVGERARTETAINEGTLSLAAAAVRLASRQTDVTGETALVVGAGEMGRLAAEAFAERADRLLVANRTVPHAEHVAETVDVDASAIALEAVPAAVSAARVVVTATGSPDHVVTEQALRDAGETVVVDLAQPRDVPAVADVIDGVTVQDLDALEAVTQETREQRQSAAEAVEAMVDEEFDRLISQFKRKRADQVVSAMYESAEQVKATELRTALSKLDLDAEEREVVESMADAIVSQLLAAPTRSLRDAAEEDDWSTIHTALELFDPEFGPEDVDDGPATPEEVPEALGDELPAGVREELRDD